MLIVILSFPLIFGLNNNAMASAMTYQRDQVIAITALYRRGLVYNRLKDHNGAIRDFSKAIKYDKDNAAAYYDRSLSYKRIGKADESTSDLKKAAELGDVRARRLSRR